MVITGGLDLSPPGTAVPFAGHMTSMDAHGVPFERLDVTDIMRRYPQFTLEEGTVDLYQEQSGLAPASQCIAVHQRLTRRYGTTLRDNTPVTTITLLADGVDVW